MTIQTARQGTTPVILAYAFRPFFLLTALYAIVLIIGWMGIWFMDWPVAGELSPVRWHAHEMLFGLVSAAIAGFLLTAMCNWTSSPPLAGPGLAALVALWLAGRVTMWSTAFLPPLIVTIINCAFLLVLAVYAGRVIVRAGSRRNLVMVGVLAVLFLANLSAHLGYWWLGPAWAQRGELTAMFLIVLLLVVIGGRITPAFTANWLSRQGGDRSRIRTWSVVEALSLGSTAALILSIVIGLPPAAIATLALFAGLVNAIRLVGWAGWLTRSDPLVWVLHLGYAWVVIGLLLMGGSLFFVIPDSAWLHALGTGAMGTLILGVMTRVSLGHTGRGLVLPSGAWLIYVAISVAAVVRVASAMGWLDSRWPLLVSSLAWVVAFALFFVLYLPILTSPRADGRPG
ncbi:MAG: NnrS family protein [Wenzhouxiangella sp.]